MDGDKGGSMENEKQSVAPKFTDLAQLTHNNGVKLDAVVTLLGVIAESNDANVRCSNDILEEKKSNHKAWLWATTKRFYQSLVTIVLMVTALYLEVFTFNKESEFVRGVLAVFGWL